MALAACDRVHGATILIERDPCCAVFEDVMYLPVFTGETLEGGITHGLYGADGGLIGPAGRYRGARRERAGPAPSTAQRPQGLPFHAGPFFYLGRVTEHYGHFLLDTLCRLWAWPQCADMGAKILFHDWHGVERLFALPFAATIFRACGLGPADFVKFEGPVRLGQVIVPEPGFEELHFIHSVYARQFNALGDVLCPGPPPPRSDTPVYFTKHCLREGISRFVNEERFADRLARAGVEIIAPETLPFAEQVGLFRKYSRVSGLIGSVFHTSLFTPACRMLVLNYGRTIWANQLLIDRANRNETEFVHDPEASPSRGAGEGFMNNFEMADPVRLAEDFLRLLEPPARAPAAKAPAPALYRHAICACARWETPYIVEWLNYYRELGFDHVYLYCNDDDPGPLYEKLLPFTAGPAPFLTFRHHPHQGQQFEMYAHFAAHGLGQTQWVSFLDIDEYLRLPPGMKIGDFMSRFIPEVECVLFNWVFFGPNGHKTPPAGNVLENYTRRVAGIHPFTKFVARAAAVAALDFADRERTHGFWHEFETKLDRQVVSANVIGEPIHDYLQGFPERSEAIVNEPARREVLLATAVIHHYAFRSEQAFAERSARGLKGAFSGQDAWRRIAEGPEFATFVAGTNAVEDTSLAGFWQEVRARAATLGTGLPESAPAAPRTPARPDLISRGKAALQSSHSVHSFAPTPAQDAARAVNGVLDGARHFHTDLEDDPWWQVDLGGIATITEIHIHNTADVLRARFRDFTLSVSIDGESWAALAEKRDGAAVEAPFIWSGPGTAWARFVRVTLRGRDHLHLCQVEVFGRLP